MTKIEAQDKLDQIILGEMRDTERAVHLSILGLQLTIDAMEAAASKKPKLVKVMCCKCHKEVTTWIESTYYWCEQCDWEERTGRIRVSVPEDEPKQPQAEPPDDSDMPKEIWVWPCNSLLGFTDKEPKPPRHVPSGLGHYIRYDEHERLMREQADEYDTMIDIARAEEQDIAEEAVEMEMRKQKPCPTCAKVRKWCDEEITLHMRPCDLYQAGYTGCAETILGMMDEEAKE